MSDTEFESFVMNAGPDILRFCRIITNNKEQGDELYQDAMVLLLEKRASLKAEQNSKSYALSVAVLLWKNKKKKYANRMRIAPVSSLEEHHGNGFFICGGLGHDTGTDDDQQTGDCRGEKCSADATRKISNSNLLKLQCWADNGRNCNMYESAGQYGENKNPKGKINFKTGIGGERN